MAGRAVGNTKPRAASSCLREGAPAFPLRNRGGHAHCLGANRSRGLACVVCERVRLATPPPPRTAQQHHMCGYSLRRMSARNPHGYAVIEWLMQLYPQPYPRKGRGDRAGPGRAPRGGQWARPPGGAGGLWVPRSHIKWQKGGTLLCRISDRRCAPFIQFVDVLHGLDFCSNAPLNANKILSRNRIAARTEPVNFQPMRIRAELAGSA